MGKRYTASDPTMATAVSNADADNAGDELRRRQAIREQADAARNARIRQRHQQVHRD